MQLKVTRKLCNDKHGAIVIDIKNNQLTTRIIFVYNIVQRKTENEKIFNFSTYLS